MKGQHLTVEQMFLFTIGLLITISIFFSFRSISGHVTDFGEEDQMYEVGALVLTGVQRVAKELEANDRATLSLEVPRGISRSEYTVFVDGAVMRVLLGDKNVTFGMEGLENSYIITGRATSAEGKIIIEGTQSDRSIRVTR